MRILGIDPGTHKTAMGSILVQDVGLPKARFVYEGARWFDNGDLRQLVLAPIRAKAFDLVAIELPEHVTARDIAAARAMGEALMGAMRVAGRIEGVCETAAQRFVMMPSTFWRATLGCTGTRNEKADDRIARIVPFFVKNMPSVTNKHVRDALGVATAAAVRLSPGGRALGL